MVIDLRSDTVTRPTENMRKAMATAEVGDDVYGEDPTVRRLEETGAAMVGKEAALFVPSGTMGNQIAVLAHVSRGDEVLVEADSHIFYYEAGGLAFLSGVQTRVIPGKNGFMEPELLRQAVREKDIHQPRTGLLCLENTHNRAGGTVLTPEETELMAAVARENGIPVHLDGARIFNAACRLGVKPGELTRPVDSVMFCLSKGLGAPVGSLLAGSSEFIKKARKYRKLLGGGMRQAGVLAAAGLVALEEMVDRLVEDHEHARFLAEGLAEIPGLSLDPATVQTNIILFSVEGLKMTAGEFLAVMKEEGVLGVPFGKYTVRFVTHKDVSLPQIKTALQTIKKIAAGVKR